MPGRIVIADDSPTLRRIVTSVLTAAGFEVVQAADGVEAVQAVFREQPDAVVMDVQMPRVSGYVATRLLKDDWQTADIPVVLLTSLDAASDRYWGGKTGAEHYLTKDFEAPDLTGAVQRAIDGAAAVRGGRPNLRPDKAELSDDDVLSKICDLLDRKLFETSVGSEVTSIAVSTHGMDETVGALLDLLRRFVEFHLGMVMLLHERAAYVTVAHETCQPHFDAFLSRAAETISASAGTPLEVGSMELKITDPNNWLGDQEEGPMATFLSMPLRGHGGQVVGTLALSSSIKQAFSETALNTLKLVEGPAAVVIDSARQSLTQPA